MAANEVQRRPGGRTAHNRQKVARATAEILLDEGYEKLSIARVAAAAEVAESTIYRRWPTKALLTAEAIAELARAENPIPDTGTLKDDLRALLTQIVRLVSRPDMQRVIRTVVALDGDGDEMEKAKKTFWDTRFAGSATIVERAVARGELPPDVDSGELIEDLASVVYFRLLVTGRPLDDRVIERSVRRVLQPYSG